MAFSAFACACVRSGGRVFARAAIANSVEPMFVAREQRRRTPAAGDEAESAMPKAKRGPGRPKGSPNKRPRFAPKPRGRPQGSKNKPKAPIQKKEPAGRAVRRQQVKRTAKGLTTTAKAAGKPEAERERKAVAAREERNRKERERRARKKLAATSAKPAPKKKPASKGQPASKGIVKKEAARRAPPPRTTSAKRATRTSAVVAKPALAAEAKAPAPLRRNTTLETRGKDQTSGLRPVSRTAGTLVSPAKAGRPAKPLPKARKSMGGAAGEKIAAKRSAPATQELAAPASKRAKTAPAAKLPKDNASVKPAAAPPLRRNTTLETRGKDQSSGLRPVSRTGGTPSSPAKPAASKTLVSPRPDKGKAAAHPAQRSPASTAILDSVSASGFPKPLPKSALEQYYTYSRQGQKSKSKWTLTTGDRREKKIPWEESETKALATCVVEFSKSWAAMLRARPDLFHPSRTPVDLKDKWRNMHKALARGKHHTQAPTHSAAGGWGGGGGSSGSVGSSSASPSKSPSKHATKATKPLPQHLRTHFRQKVDGRARVPWTDPEVKALTAGFKKFGSKWTSILLTSGGVSGVSFHPSRTSLDLKDKWRNITKSGGDTSGSK